MSHSTIYTKALIRCAWGVGPFAPREAQCEEKLHCQIASRMRSIEDRNLVMLDTHDAVQIIPDDGQGDWWITLETCYCPKHAAELKLLPEKKP